MNKLLLVLFLGFVAILFPQQGHAQFGDLRMFDFQCRPASCTVSVPLTTQGFGDLTAQADCGNGNPIDRESTIEIGIPDACFLPFSGVAQAEIISDSFKDECGETDFIDTLEELVVVIDLFANPVQTSVSDDDCTPSHSAETEGTIPCGLFPE